MKNVLTFESFTKLIYVEPDPVFKKTTTLFGRKFEVNSDGSVTIFNKNGVRTRVRFSLTMGLGVVNVVGIHTSNDGCLVKSKSNRQEKIENEKIKKIINFIDSNSEETTLDSGNLVKPDLQITKIKK
jgi:diaminopimelate epimerase